MDQRMARPAGPPVVSEAKRAGVTGESLGVVGLGVVELAGFGLDSARIAGAAFLVVEATDVLEGVLEGVLAGDFLVGSVRFCAAAGGAP